MSDFVCPGSSFRNCAECEHGESGTGACEDAYASHHCDGDCGHCRWVDCENNFNYSGYWEKEESGGSVDYDSIGEGEY